MKISLAVAAVVLATLYALPIFAEDENVLYNYKNESGQRAATTGTMTTENGARIFTPREGNTRYIDTGKGAFIPDDGSVIMGRDSSVIRSAPRPQDEQGQEVSPNVPRGPVPHYQNKFQPSSAGSTPKHRGRPDGWENRRSRRR